jgi:hypothetical protein
LSKGCRQKGGSRKGIRRSTNFPIRTAHNP